ncbi:MULTISPECIES: hypothetical protein [Pantoea]|uniref:Uncharacterized protein n=2 Tax=Pantoea TaxID=53335 RepID=A0AB34CLQ3_9GAMM|nr:MULTISPECIES: hypothetical protein [Pantoea]KAA5930348.1 hypothetical protein F3I59_08960 [Pantoea sp. VH_8]KAA5986916.1 hypothetical protein F3I49_08900 [Pantoea sp. M_4]KAA6126020.1 hypothetical protein F3I20_08740 [Pantoea gossypiicola]
MEVPIKTLSHSKVAMITFVISFLIFFARFPQPVITPTIYAEDGVWIGSALSNGWLYTFLHARPDYFVFFNIFFLFSSALLSKVFSGSVLMLLPLFIALISYAFYALTSVIIYFTVRRYANNMMAVLAFMMSVLVPLGVSQAESIGTLVQIGFYMPVLSICAHLYRDSSSCKKRRAVCDILIFLMAATNPVNFAVTGSYLFIKFFCTEDKKKLLIGFAPLLVAMLVLFIVIVPRMNGSGGILGAFNSSNLIEMLTARSILFPFVFSFYDKLGNASAIILTLGYFLLILVAYIKAEPQVRISILLLFFMLIIYDAATAAGRSGITGLLNGYNSTYPDRYFMGINIISSVLIAVCLGQFKKRRFRYVVVLLLIIVYACGLKNTFESSQDKRRIPLDYIYTNALCSASDEGTGFSRIKILPSADWYIRLPSGYVQSIGCVK